MASFFSLGGGGGGDGGGRSGANNQQEQNNNNNEISPESWFLYSRNNNNNNNSPGQVDLHNSPFKGFDLGYGKPAHHPIHYQLQGSGRRSDMVSDQSRSAATFLMMTSGGPSSTSSGGGGGGISCQDCGNQAKKDCMYLRCRTCCKSRGFHCQTHVKSTWVPAAKRRERHQRIVGLQHQAAPQQQDQNYQTLQFHRSDRDDNLLAKRLKGSHLVANLDASSGLEATNFPAEVTSVAVFRCVRVSSVDNANNQHAYQTSVKIGGHLFKGILYDQGLDSSHHEHHQLAVRADEDSSAAGGRANVDIQQLNFMNANSSSVPAAGAAAPANSRGGATPSSQLTGFLDPCLYNSAASLNTFMAGTQFFPPPRT